jgi:hypothetical protein
MDNESGLKSKSACIPVYSNRLAGVLMSKGYVLINMKPNTRQAERNVFYFVDSPQLQAEISNYKTNK